MMYKESNIYTVRLAVPVIKPLTTACTVQQRIATWKKALLKIAYVNPNVS